MSEPPLRQVADPAVHPEEELLPEAESGFGCVLGEVFEALVALVDKLARLARVEVHHSEWAVRVADRDSRNRDLHDRSSGGSGRETAKRQRRDAQFRARKFTRLLNRRPLLFFRHRLSNKAQISPDSRSHFTNFDPTEQRCRNFSRAYVTDELRESYVLPSRGQPFTPSLVVPRKIFRGKRNYMVLVCQHHLRQ